MRILFVEDFRSYRSVIASLLGKSPHLHSVFEAEDGVEAVEQAQQLKPDVILMDIGLPKLNGIEAARQIRELGLSPKIVFLTQKRDDETVKEAFRLGASGYVLKDRAKADLPVALSAVLQGRRFLSSGLSDRGL
jgi:DNA-binding NarL/FixJ family response regulator